MVFHRKDSPHAYAGYDAAGMATLLPLGKQLANGGRLAEREMMERLVQALKPMRKEPDNAPPASQVGRQLGSSGRAGKQSARGLPVALALPQLAAGLQPHQLTICLPF